MYYKHFTQNIICIDLKALASNYLAMKNFVGPNVECAATVKANAYGMGAKDVMRCLSKVGCNKFFVANLDEALALRNLSLTDDIYVLSGIFAGEESEFVQHNILPVLNNAEQFTIYNRYCTKKSKNFPAILNIDTGINRLGFAPDEVYKLASTDFFKQKVKLNFMMSHLACADDPNNTYNEYQLQSFIKLKNLLKLPASLADSSGVCLGERYHFDLVRPGMMLYGTHNTPTPFTLKPVVTLTTKIIQIKTLTEDEFIGYGNSRKMPKGSVLATIPLGHADGLSPTLGNKAVMFIAGQIVPILGKISMDTSVLDVTNIANDFLHIGAEVELLGEHQSIESMAKEAQTSCHDILVAFGNARRFKKILQ